MRSWEDSRAKLGLDKNKKNYWWQIYPYNPSCLEKDVFRSKNLIQNFQVNKKMIKI